MAFAGSQPVSLIGKFQNPGPHFTGGMEIRAEKIAVRRQAVRGGAEAAIARHAGLAQSARHVQCLLQAVAQRSATSAAMQQFGQRHARPSNRCFDQLRQVPLPADQPRRLAANCNDGQWTFRQAARHATGRAWSACRAELSTCARHRAGLASRFEADNVPLDEELRTRCSRACGDCGIRCSPTARSTSRRATSASTRAPAEAGVRLQSDSARRRALRSALRSSRWRFPIACGCWAAGSTITTATSNLYDVQRLHGATELRTAGSCDILPDGAWQLRLERLTVDRVRLHGEDQELVAALPEALRRAVTELKPGGPINLQWRGRLVEAAAGRAAVHRLGRRPVHASRCSCKPVRSWKTSTAASACAARPRGRDFASHGELQLDSLTYKNFQFTGSHRTALVRQRQRLSGRTGVRQRRRRANAPAVPPRHVRAKLLGGVLSGDGHVRLGAVPQYRPAGYRWNRSSWLQFASENLAGDQQLNGKLAGQVELVGTPRSAQHARHGHASTVRRQCLRTAVDVPLLKIARAKPPDARPLRKAISNSISNRANISSSNRSISNGDAINLSGHGELTLDGQTNPMSMELHMSGGRGGIPIVSGMLNEAGKQILLIHVGGTLQNPTTRTEPLPAANQALQMFQRQAGEASGGEAKSRRIPRRTWDGPSKRHIVRVCRPSPPGLEYDIRTLIP